MKILAIDTSSEICGVALLEDNNLIQDNSLNNGKTHSENLMILIKEILENNNVDLKDIDLISCVVGPGSFTGIRIGVSTVKALSEVNQIPIAEVTSLETLAENIGSVKTKVAMIDARNDQVYCGIFDENNNLIEPYIANSIEFVIDKLKKYENIEFSGNGAIKFKELITKKLNNVKFCNCNEQIAENVGRIGLRKYKLNKVKNADELLPIYLRKSQAERMKNKED